MLRENLEQMFLSGPARREMDCLIIATSERSHEAYWQQRLEGMRGKILSPNTLILSVYEDWEGGAGNGLGTLYAFEKAAALAKTRYGIDLREFLHKGHTCALYHTAGKGTRLAPLALSASKDKSRVMLPSGTQPTQTLLEAVIRQTGFYAKGREGRLSVFWGDQVFIPSNPPAPSTHPADILVRKMPFPDEETWEKKHLSSYGLAAISSKGAQLLDKMSYSQVRELNDQGVIDTTDGVGVSLGSFSVSVELLEAFLEEFKSELHSRTEKYDSDPHFWMPLTLDRKTYCALMEDKGISKKVIDAHYHRMERFAQLFGTAPLFNAVDVGEEALWWDYGTTASYYANGKKTLSDTQEGEWMRKFYGLEPRVRRSALGDLEIDEQSILIDCAIRSGTVKGSVLIGVHGDHVEVSGSIMMHCRANVFRCEGSLLYQVEEEGEYAAAPQTVRADCDGLPIETDLGRDGKEDWLRRIKNNSFSYEEIYQGLALLNR